MNDFESSDNSGRARPLLVGAVNMTDMSHPAIFQPLLGLEQKRDAVLAKLNHDAMRWLRSACSLLASLWHRRGRPAAGYLRRSRQRQIETMLP